jgi:hypothetical protein
LWQNDIMLKSMVAQGLFAKVVVFLGPSMGVFFPAISELSTLGGYGVLARRPQNPILAEVARFTGVKGKPIAHRSKRS